MKFARILSLILAVLMMACMFVACDTTDGSETPDTPAADQQAKAIALNVVEGGYTGYTIVRDYKASGEILGAVTNLQNSFRDYLGCEIQVKECYNDRQEAEDVVTNLEILVGMTNRPESAQVADGLKTNDYKVDVVGEKIVIVGGSDDATEKAISKFMNALITAQGNKGEVQSGVKQNMSVYKGLPENDPNKKYDVDIDTFASTGKYSYGKATMANARIDSYLVVYPRTGAMTASNRLVAETLQDHVNRHTGYAVDAKKDAAVVRADYMILVGETTFTDSALADAIGDNDYYIALKETENGAVLTILYGIDAEEAALKAFTEQIMPASSAQIDFNMTAGFVLTNNPALAQ